MDTTTNTKNDSPDAPNCLIVNRGIRMSGLLASLSPEDFQTLVALLTFADGSGRCELSARILGQSLNLSENQARRRLNSLCRIQWQGKSLVQRDMDRECGKFVSSAYQVGEVDGMKLLPNSHAGCGKSSRDGSVVHDSNAADRAKGTSSSEAPAAEARDVPVVGIDNINKHNTGTQDGALETKDRIHMSLIKVGVSGSITDELIGRYPAERLIRQLGLLPFRNAKEPAAMLVKAIREDWSAPSAYMLREKEKARKREKVQTEAREAEERKLWQEKIESAKARLSRQELDDIRRAARENILRNLGHVFHGDAPEKLVNSEVNRIIAKRHMNHEKR